MISRFFDEAPCVSVAEPLGLIVPHAGYLYSGPVAAAAYKQVDRHKKFDHIFLIGSSHLMHFEGASVYTGENFLTPLGKIKVDPLARKLVGHNKVINEDRKPHIREHSLEVQLPFLQYWMLEPFSIIPIIIGGEDINTSRKLANVLFPYFNERNLFIISSDFSHYPSYDDAVKYDTIMAEVIAGNSPEKFLSVLNEIESKGITNLATALCGWTSVLALLEITLPHKDLAYRKILYRNSGDLKYGDKDKVVGYNAICITKNARIEKKEIQLSDSDKKFLLQIAREAIRAIVAGNKLTDYYAEKMPADLLIKTGAFVTLLVNGTLRGCIGNMHSDKELFELIRSLAIASSTRDCRFLPINKNELSQLEIEISVLSPMKKINSIDDIIMGKHGIYIVKGDQAGTFLPQVAGEMHWTKEEFLGHCSREKTLIGWEGWKKADIYIYEAIVFSENQLRVESDHDLK